MGAFGRYRDILVIIPLMPKGVEHKHIYEPVSKEGKM